MDKKKLQEPSIPVARPRKKTAHAQIESRFRAVFENSRDAIGVSRTGIHLFENPAYLNLFGFPPGTALAGKPIIDVIAPGCHDQIKGYILRRKQGKSAPSFYETRGLRANGTEFDMEVNVSIYQENGEDHTLVILRDITERKKAAEEIAERSAMLQQIMDTASVAIFLVDRAGRITHANRHMAEMFGCTLEELTGSEYVAHVHPSEREIGRQKMLALLASKLSSVDLERLYWKKDGTEFWGHLAGRRFHDVHGNEVGLIGVITDIDKRKQTEKALSVSEARYRRLYNETPVLLHSIDRNGVLVEVNDYWLKTLGYERYEVIGKKVSDFFTEKSKKYAEECVQPIFFREGIAKDISYQFVKRNGEIIDGLLSATAQREVDGTIIRSQAVIEDVTERKRAEEVLRESENRTRSIIESIPIGMHMYRLEPEGQLVFTGANPAADRILCVDNSIFIGKAIEEAFPALAATEVPQRYREVAATGKTWSSESLEYEEGRIKGAFDVHAFQTGANAIAVAFKDVTEHKQTEEALAKSEKMLQTIIDAEPECVKLVDENGCLIMMNPAGLDMLQVDSLDQVRGRCIYPLVASEYRPAFMELTARIFQGESGTLLFEIVGMKGRRLWLETLAVPLRNEKNAITALLGITRDITARKRAGDELREKEEMYRLLFESAHEGIFIQDESGFMDCNQRGAEMYGLSKEELLGRHPDEFAPERQPDGRLSSQVASEKIQAAMSGLPQVFEWQPLRSDGTLFDVEIALSRLELAGKTCLLAIVRDMTDRKRLEQEYLKSQKLESIGTLAGGIAHDFNNLLQGIFGYISMAKMTYDQKEKSLPMLKQAEEALQLAVNLTKQLLTFSKGGKPIRKLISLRPVVENAVKFALSGSQTDYQIDIADDLWPIEADEGQLAQVIQNIVLNADEAMAGRGTVGIVLRNRVITMNVPSGLAAGGQFVCIDILDSGTGISRQNLSKIFDPYFSTKQRGSGLGLATSYSIIRNHDGVIEVRSEADKGTTFTIYLPAASGDEPPESDTTAKGITGKTGRILLMDDEPLIRNVAAEMIRTLGHDVESAEEGKTALDMFIRAREAGQPYDVVVLDLTVKGGMGGEETIRQMLEINPGVKAVVSSGYADSPVVAKYHEHGFSAFLNKPYKLDALQDCLGALIK